jgi:Pectate lyase superfamily protein
MFCGNKLAPAALLVAAFLLLLGAPGASASEVARSGKINVLDSGARGDCVHDDAAAINSAVRRLENAADAAPTALHSGMVYFPRPPDGCYLVRAPIILSGPTAGEANFAITLQGDGRGVSVIRAGAAIRAVLMKDATWEEGDTITDLTFDANALADHAIAWLGGTGVRFSRIEALNGKVDDLYLSGADARFFTDSLFMNSTTFPPYNIYIDGSSTDNEFTDDLAVNASFANIVENGGGSNHFISNHAYGYPQNLCPRYSFVVADQSIWIGNQSDCSREAAFLVTSWSAIISGNLIQGAMNHGICLSPSGGDNTIVSNQTVFGNPNGTVKAGVAPANAIVQGVMQDQAIACAGPGVRTATWGTGKNYGASNVVLNNTPTSNENLWNTIYTSGGQRPAIGIGTTEPQARLDVDGAIRVGESILPCGHATAGTIRFDSSAREFLGCNGTSWILLNR